jgi:cyclic lactone autoinducer peptide
MGITKKIRSSIILPALAFIGAIGIITPNCLGWFYEPKRPKELN